MSSSYFFKISQLPADKTLILFDGYCNLCNATVQFILKHDRHKKFYFAGISWPVGVELLRAHADFKEEDSILVYHAGKMYAKSTAALKIATGLGGFYKLWGLFWILPRFIRDGLYMFIARNRYTWFGRKDHCMIPDEKVSKRFFEEG